MAKIWNQEQADKYIPGYMQEGLRRYLELGIMPGDFLTAVLENDLKGAVSHADLVNQRMLAQYVTYLYNFAPRDCWGSPERVKKWIEAHRQKCEACGEILSQCNCLGSHDDSEQRGA